MAGGCVSGVRSGPYTLDAAVGAIARGVEDELRDGILAHLGARERCELIPLDYAYRVVSLAFELEVPNGLDAMIDVHCDRFPLERGAIADFFRTCDRILEDTHRLPLVLPFDQLDELAARFPTFVRYRTATLAEALDEFFSDELLKRVVAASWPWAGLPPSRLSFTTFAQGLALLSHGTYAVRGSFARLVSALVGGFEDAGGTLLTSAEAVRIVVEDGRVAAVELADGRMVTAPAVVSNADATATFDRLLGVPSANAAQMRPSCSACVLFLAVRGASHGPTETFVADHDSGAWVSAPTLADASLAPPREHVLAVRALATRESPIAVDRLIGLADRAFAGVAERATVIEALAPADFERRTANRDGAIYGWENTPRQTGSRRLGIVGPVPGLYLAGHWAQPGHGAYRAVLSGMHAARALLSASGASDAIPDFRAPG